MSIREGLLALLSGGPKYGYQLKSEFEAHTGSVWPLNVGQVYTTLDRLERDSLVIAGQADAEGRKPYHLTVAGRKVLEGWFAEAEADAAPPRDELVMKVLLAVACEGTDPLDVVIAQRDALMATLRAHRRRRQGAADASDLSGALMFDALVTRVEGELRWLDLCEERLRAETTGKGTTR